MQQTTAPANAVRNFYTYTDGKKFHIWMNLYKHKPKHKRCDFQH